jgi:PAS domain S-box-containing protein
MDISARTRIGFATCMTGLLAWLRFAFAPSLDAGQTFAALMPGAALVAWIAGSRAGLVAVSGVLATSIAVFIQQESFFSPFGARSVVWPIAACAVLAFAAVSGRTGMQHGGRTRRAIQATPDLHQCVLASLDDAVIVTDRAGRVTFMNTAAELLTGQDLGDAYGRALDEVLHLVDDASHSRAGIHLRKHGALPGPVAARLRLTDAQGGEHLVSDRGTTLRAPDGRLLGSVIALREAPPDGMTDARSLAGVAGGLGGAFLGTVCHELRTPLNAISGWLEIIRRGAEAQTTQRGLDAIRRNVQAQTRIIDDLLEMSAVVAGDPCVVCRPVDLAAVVANAADSLRPAARARSVSFDVETDAGTTVVMGDAQQLRQVVSSLLADAVQFTPAGGRVVLRMVREAAQVRIVVRGGGGSVASGCATSGVERPGPGRQPDPTPWREPRAAGLRLAVIRYLVGLHGGAVALGAGEGAMVAVTLPLQGGAASPPEKSCTDFAERSAVSSVHCGGGQSVGQATDT